MIKVGCFIFLLISPEICFGQNTATAPRRLWQKEFGTEIVSIAVSSDGAKVAIALAPECKEINDEKYLYGTRKDCRPGTGGLYYFDKHGSLLWSYNYAPAKIEEAGVKVATMQAQSAETSTYQAENRPIDNSLAGSFPYGEGLPGSVPPKRRFSEYLASTDTYRLTRCVMSSGGEYIACAAETLITLSEGVLDTKTWKESIARNRYFETQKVIAVGTDGKLLWKLDTRGFPGISDDGKYVFINPDMDEQSQPLGAYYLLDDKGQVIRKIKSDWWSNGGVSGDGKYFFTEKALFDMNGHMAFELNRPNENYFVDVYSGKAGVAHKENRTFKLYDVESGKAIFNGSGNEFWRFNNSRVVGGKNGKLTLFELSGKKVGEFPDSGDAWLIRLVDSRKYLLIPSGGALTLLGMRSFIPEWEIKTKGKITQLGSSSDGKYIGIGLNHKFILYGSSN